MIALVTFATDDYKRSAHLCANSAKANGVDNSSIVEPTGCTEWANMRGFGHWRWKPQVILNRMNMLEGNFLPVLNDGDTLIYSDAGVEFIDNINHVISRMDQDIFLFGNNWEHAHWCKGDVPHEIFGKQRVSVVGVQNWLWQDHPEHDVNCACRPETIIFGKQVQASVIFFRVSDYTRRFVKEWLDWCLFEGGRLIDDSPSRLPSHPEFQEHRHDQAILTTMAYREGIKLHYWPAMYNDGAFIYEKLPCYAGDDYPVMFHHHRKRDYEWRDTT